MFRLPPTVVLAPAVVAAQSLADFYRGKTVTFIIGYPPAGANDIYARAVSRHIGKYIPGHPNVVARNMPGGGWLRRRQPIFNVAPKDGTVLGLIVPTARWRNGWAPPTSASSRRSSTGSAGLHRRQRTFVMSTSPVKTIQDAMKRETVLSATGRSSTVAIYPIVAQSYRRDEVQAGDGL